MPSRITVRGRAAREGEIGPNAAEREAMFTRGGTTPPPGNLRPAQEIFRAIRDLQNAPGSADRAQEIVIQAAALLGGMGIPGISAASPGATTSPAGGGMAAGGGGAMASAMNNLARAIEGPTRSSGGGFSNPLLGLISARWSQGPAEKMDPLLRRIDADIRAQSTGAGGAPPPPFVPPGMSNTPPAWPPGPQWPPQGGAGGRGGGSAATGVTGGTARGAPGWAVSAARITHAAGMPHTSRMIRAMIGREGGMGAATAAGGGEGLGGLAEEAGGLVGALSGGAVGAEIGMMVGLGVKELVGAVKTVATIPQKIGGFIASTVAAVDPWLSLNVSAIETGIGAGFSGAKLLKGGIYGGLVAGIGAPSRAMAELGWSPAQGLAAIRGWGIPQPSAAGATNLAVAIGGAQQFMPGLAFLPPGQVLQSLSAAAAAGAIGPGRVGATLGAAQLSGVLQAAQTSGMNTSMLLSSIDAGIAGMAQSGAATAAMSPGEMGDYLLRFRGAGPGGRTGALGLQSLGGINAALGTIGSEPIRTMLAARWATQFHSVAQFQKFVMAQPGGAATWQRIASGPGQMRQIQDMIIEANANHPLAAGEIAGEILQNAPDLATTLLAPTGIGRGGMTQGMRDLLKQRLLNEPSIAAALTQTNPARYGVLPAGSPTAFEEKDVPEYKKEMARLGMSASLIEQNIVAGRKSGISPLVMAPRMAMESNMGTSTHRNPLAFNQTGRQNPYQVTPQGLPKGWPAPKTRQEAITDAFISMRGDLIESGGNFEKAFAIYTGNTPAEQANALIEPAYINGKRNPLFGEGYYQQVAKMQGLKGPLAARSAEAAARVGQAQQTYNLLGGTINFIAEELANLADDMASTAAAINSAAPAPGGGGGGTFP